MSGHPVRVLGIDASLRSSGIAVVAQNGNALSSLHYSTIRNARTLPRSQCLRRIHEELLACIEATSPDAAAIEGGFHLKNARTAMVLGEVRGVMIATCAVRDIPVFEYAPRKVKLSVVGTGSAHKEQVARMVMTMLGLKAEPGEDEADALGVAICHLHSQSRHQALAAEPL